MSLSMSDAAVPSGSLGLWWLGQAGFVFKTPAGKVIYLDPYLSDAVERLIGFKRLSLPAIAAEEVRADLVLITHEHSDHLDVDALPVIARNNPACRFAAPAGCTAGLNEAGVPAGNRILLEPHHRYDLDGVVLHTAPADHGDLSETALCFVLEAERIRVFCTGDTAFRPKLHKPLVDLKPDILLPCINGVFGNMNHIDAAMLVESVKPRCAIPCHFWTFAEQGGGDPAGFVHACKHYSPETKALLLRPGERFLYQRQEPCP
jgi:L-ascorbate metabolism protein UlaG (beta-lactamase superfamily)